MFPAKSKFPLIKIIKNSLIDLPTPKNISYMWNYGSLLGYSLMLQIMTGMFLAMSFLPHKEKAFISVINMCQDSFVSWSLQMLHANGASLFFFCLFLHVGRGIYYQSYKLSSVWTVGVFLLFLSMGTAFMGYILPWGQMSFWGATVITNLLATVPYLGSELVVWLWGGFSVESPTLNRFFVFHFFLPFIMVFLVIIHLLFLHQQGSNNPLGLNSSSNKISFYPNFIYKDMLGILILMMILINLISVNPYLLGDSDNFIPANPLVTPFHIQPEWYFLFAYAILRSIPNKLGGVVALILSISILFFLPLFNNNFQGAQFFYLDNFLFWTLVSSVMLLTWIGMSPMESPFILLGQILTIVYFSLYFLKQFISNYWSNLIN